VGIDVEVDDLAFEGGSAYLLGTVLERFVSRHVSINGFTQLRMRSPGRGDILNGVARSGARPML
jgi:type VI secretion system protein ImpG